MFKFSPSPFLLDEGVAAPALEHGTMAPMGSLPEIQAKYHVPRLVDRPQNPIMDTLYLNRAMKPHLDVGFPSLPPELGKVEDNIRCTQHSEDKNLWEDAVKTNIGSRSQVKSWDALRFSRSSRASATPFLSEQSIAVYAAAQYHVLPRLKHPAADLIYVTLVDLLKSLKLTILGTSGALHTWDMESETFFQPGYSSDQKGIIVIDGNDETVSASVIQRFLTIGTLLRRLEILVASLRARSAREGPTIHAFTHCLACILSYLREMLARSPPPQDVKADQPQTLTAVWAHYAEFEELFVALSVLCNREQDKSPSEYAAIDSSPASLLSRIYGHLTLHIERYSPHIVTASFAYMLTNTSRDYIRHVCHSVGYGTNSPLHQPISDRGKRQSSLGSINEDEEPDIDDVFDSSYAEEIYPDFFPPELANSIPTAKKSLVLLRGAHPDHPLAKGGVSAADIKWFWTEEQIDVVRNNIGLERSVLISKNESWAGATDAIAIQNTHRYKKDIAAFHIFDLEPGTHLKECAERQSPSTTSSLPTFLATFPKDLPSMTPTLPIHTSQVFSPLVEHMVSLSGALLSLVLSPLSHLNLFEHLTLLRSFLLLTSHSFKSRLTSALFSDSEDPDSGKEGMAGMRAFMRPSRRQTNANNNNDQAKPWAVGLASSLTARETWPPGGADLSFHLRTVVVDSLELGHLETDDLETKGNAFGRRRVLEEAEVRLGFAIRDLPVGTGRDRWLNPLSIEALDFLYMDYKPPQPLGVLITPDVLSKYQRIFAFILRMMRVENVVRALFRMTREPLFPTLASLQKLFLHFRFIAQSFIASLSEYIFDTAIAGNFDAFLSRLSSPTHHNSSDTGFSDIFSLSSYHSAVMDDILSACLLRSGQRAVGDLLRGALELVLNFGILAGELKRGNMQEYQAAPQLEDLFHRFRGKMKTLVKVLQALVHKSSPSFRSLETFPLRSTEGHLREPPGGTASLHHLLIRLDIGEWWSGMGSERPEVL